jgi:hypothetical protein
VLSKKTFIAAATAGALIFGAGSLATANASSNSDSKNVVVVTPEEYAAAFAQYEIDLAAYEVADANREVQEDVLETAAEAQISALKAQYAQAIVDLAIADILVLKTDLKIAINAIEAQLELDELALGAEPIKPAKPVLASDLPAKKDKKKKHRR